MKVIERLTAAEIQLRSPSINRVFLIFQVFSSRESCAFITSSSFRVVCRALSHRFGSSRHLTFTQLNLHKARVRRNHGRLPSHGFIERAPEHRAGVTTALEHAVLSPKLNTHPPVLLRSAIHSGTPSGSPRLRSREGRSVDRHLRIRQFFVRLPREELLPRLHCLRNHLLAHSRCSELLEGFVRRRGRILPGRQGP